jgi:3-dehydroquinate dehydratase I
LNRKSKERRSSKPRGRFSRHRNATASQRKRLSVRPRVVGVLASRADLGRALELHNPPDLFELRLDYLAGAIDEQKLSRLRAPLIITARPSREGGANKLSIRQRYDLLSRFLPFAKYVDVELRSASAFRSLLDLAEQQKVQRIISFHDFKSTPSARVLIEKAHAAKRHGANIFKVATRTDTAVEVARLLELVASENAGLPVSAMGMGRLGAISRVLLARAGSALVYASIGRRTNIEGQLSLEQLRRLGIASRRWIVTRFSAKAGHRERAQRSRRIP